MERRREFAYGRSYFHIRFVLLLALFAFFLAFLALQTQTPVEWVALLAVVLAAYLLVVGFTPMLTNHWLTRSRLVLRQGWYFRVSLPLADVEAVRPYDGEPKFGLRLILAARTLFVVGSRTNLVSVRLRAPRRFSQVLFLRAKEIVFDVDDREDFLAAVKEREARAERLPAYKVPILPAARR